MRSLLKQFSKEILIDFIAGYAETDAKFAGAVYVNFDEPDAKADLIRIGRELEAMFEDAPIYGRDRWESLDFDTSGILSEIKRRAEQGHIGLAFAQAELLYRKLLESFEYQHECEVSDEAEECLAVMSEIAGNAVLAKDKEYIFRQCIALADIEDGRDFGADYEGRLLLIAAKLVTAHNLSDMENALIVFCSALSEEESALVRLQIIINIEGENAAKSFIAENLHFREIREIAYDRAISAQDFKEAEQLCLGALSSYERYYARPWLYKLYHAYELTGDAPKMADTAEEIFLRGDMGYYEKLKPLLVKQGLWEASYPELLNKCAQRLSYDKYMDILALEQEYDLLMEQVRLHPVQVYRYGEPLAAKYRDGIRAIFTAQIEKEAAEAYGRTSYSQVCSYILCFAQAGYRAEAGKTIDEFKLKYKRKPAFVDELKKIAGEIAR